MHMADPTLPGHQSGCECFARHFSDFNPLSVEKKREILCDFPPFFKFFVGIFADIFVPLELRIELVWACMCVLRVCMHKLQGGEDSPDALSF